MRAGLWRTVIFWSPENTFEELHQNSPMAKFFPSGAPICNCIGSKKRGFVRPGNLYLRTLFNLWGAGISLSETSLINLSVGDCWKTAVSPPCRGSLRVRIPSSKSLSRLESENLKEFLLSDSLGTPGGNCSKVPAFRHNGACYKSVPR
jgi:hypothetical protein